jgi:hypothetical protein
LRAFDSANFRSAHAQSSFCDSPSPPLDARSRGHKRYSQARSACRSYSRSLCRSRSSALSPLWPTGRVSSPNRRVIRYAARTSPTFPAPGHGFAKEEAAPLPVGGAREVPIKGKELATTSPVAAGFAAPWNLEAFSVADFGSPLSSSPIAAGFYRPRRAHRVRDRNRLPCNLGKSQRMVLFCSRAV